MSLVGNLEDLSLPDILQIVSLSKKSGFLMLEREGQQGKILIRKGRVIQTVSPRPGKSLGELLTVRGLVRPDDLKTALETQRSGENRELLGAILVRQGLIDQTSLEKVVQEQIEDAIVFFLSWKEGTFSFELADIQGRGEFSVDPQAFILERGIDTQWLVLEGTRLIDERSRVAATCEPSEAPAEAGGETSFAELDDETPPAARGLPLVLVEDDAVFRSLAEERLTRLGFRVVACDGVAAGLAAIEREAGGGGAPVLVTDIVMPTSDNQGFLGGLELIETVRKSRPELRIVSVTAYPDENVKAKVVESGGEFFLKPGGEEVGDFFEKIAAALGAAAPALAPAVASAAKAASGAGNATRPAPTATPVSRPVPSSSPPPAPVPAPAAAVSRIAAARTAHDTLAAAKSAIEGRARAVADASLPPHMDALLRDMLEELQSPRATSEIGLLILRFAAELLNRAVLFVVKGGRAVGLGGFGVEAAGGPERRGIRGISIPLDEPSLLEQAVRRKTAVRGPLGQARWDRHLLDSLGGQTPAEAVALPLVSGGRVRVILYGDDLPEQRALAGLRALEIFLAQAGFTLEKVLLEKKLQETAAAPRGSGERRAQHVGGNFR